MSDVNDRLRVMFPTVVLGAIILSILHLTGALEGCDNPSAAEYRRWYERDRAILAIEAQEFARFAKPADVREVRCLYSRWVPGAYVHTCRATLRSTPEPFLFECSITGSDNGAIGCSLPTGHQR